VTQPSFAAILLDATGEILLLVDPVSLKICAANLTAQKLLGYTADELIGKEITEIEGALADVFFWEEVRNGGRPELQDAESLYRRVDGEMLYTSRSVFVPPSAPDYIVIRARVISTEKKAEEELALMTSQLRATLEATADGILVRDRQGGISNMNRRFSQMWHIPDELLLRHEDGRLLNFIGSQVVHPEGYEHSLNDTHPDSEDESFEALALADGRMFECKSRPARHGEQIIGRVYCFTDVTRRHQTEQALIATRDAATAASRAKGEFLAMMSHEIRTPMNGILGMAQLLQSTPLNAEQYEYVHTMHSSGEALLAIINDILDYSKIEAHKLQLEATPFRLDTLLSDLGGLFMVQASEKGLSYTTEIAPQTPLGLSGDPVRLRQILVNLIGNAIKFTQHGGIAIRIYASNINETNARLHFTVKDSGIGISADKQDHIFTPFEQADMSTTRRFGGTGLGLSISRMLCELMEGKIGVNSTPGQGAEFWFEVNIGIHSESLPSAEHSCPTGLPVPASAKVLVVEDNNVNVLVLNNLLKKIGATQITTSHNGCEALQACSEDDFDVIFMDTHMPEMDGLEATRALRARGQGMYIIGVSADAMQSDRTVALAAGMNDYITKPVSLSGLRHAIEVWQSGR
jgi:two-component system, sensor histidine kinase